MNWAHIGLAGVIGGLSALVAKLFVRNHKEKKVAFAIVIALCFVVLNSISTKYVKPHVDSWYYGKQISNSLLELQVYQEIKKYDPKLYEQIEHELKLSISRGETEAQATARIRSAVSENVSKYIPVASDEALIHFTEITIDTMKQLTEIDPSLTYSFLFPKEYGTIQVGKYVTEQNQTALLGSLAEIIRTGASNPKVITDLAIADLYLENVRTKLYQKYGDELYELSDLHSPKIDKRRACNFMIDLYEEVLKLPEGQKTLVLRSMFSGE
jgi:hypothetical protein